MLGLVCFVADSLRIGIPWDSSPWPTIWETMFGTFFHLGLFCEKKMKVLGNLAIWAKKAHKKLPSMVFAVL